MPTTPSATCSGSLKALVPFQPSMSAGTSCAKCHRTNLVEVVILEPCGHEICPRCMIQRLVRWPVMFKQCACPCRGCKTPILAHTYHSPGSEERVVEHPEPTADKNKDPFRYFKKLPDRDSNMVLSAAYEVDGRPAVITLVMNMDTGPQTDEEEKKLLHIAALLHPALLRHSQVVDNPNVRVPRLSPPELENFAIYQDHRLLTKFLYALASGQAKVRAEELDTTDTRKRYLASFIASEVISRVNACMPGRLHVAIADLLEKHGVATKVRLALSKLGISASTAHMRRLASEAAVDPDDLYSI